MQKLGEAGSEVVDTTLDAENIGGNIACYLEQSELRAIVRTLQSYPGKLQDEAASGLHKLEQTLDAS